MIELDGVKKKFGARPAVADLDLTVAPGEIFGLLGHNGAGKSTAIGMMLGQVWPTRGTVRVCGHDVHQARAKALQRVGAIFEAPAFYDYLSGWKNLKILSGYSAPVSPARLAEVIEWVGLSGREHSRVRTYSHGMRARLALAQALLPGPELLILDEPTDGLDPEGIHEMRQTILQLHREFGLTILLSSHLLHEVEQLCTRIAVMKAGRKVFEGNLASARTARKLVRLRVADFPAAAAILVEKKWIEEGARGEMIELKEGAATERIVRELVHRGIDVYEIARVEETLEDFYLRLMKSSSDEQVRAAGPDRAAAGRFAAASSD